jgi:glycosyltransferase involved in cell wall biosynthesis
MLNKPKVSLLIPIHGEAIYFDKTLDSLLQISYGNLEIILILDRATEKVRFQAKQFCESMPGTVVVDSLKPGISHALNTGISVSSGKYIGRLDSDDLILPTRIEIQVSFLEENLEYSVVGTQMLLISEEGEHISETNFPSSNFGIRTFLKVRNCIGHPTVLIRKSALEKVKGYRSFFNGAEDLDLWLRIALVGKFKNLDLSLTKYRISNNQTSTRLKNNPGLIEEAVWIANTIGKNSDVDFYEVSVEEQIAAFVQGMRINYKSHPIIRRHKCLKQLCRVESQTNRSALTVLEIIWQGFLVSPKTTILFTLYGLMNFRKKWLK